MESQTRQRLVQRAAILLILIAVPLSLWSLTFTEAYRDWRWGRAPLPELEKAAARDSSDPVLLYHLGAALNAQGRFQDALPLLERATGLDPDRSAYRDAWAKALLATGQFSQAFSVLSQYVQTHPNSAEGHLYLARFYVAQNQYDHVMEECEAAIRRNPNLAEAWWLEAIAQQQLNSDIISIALGKARRAVALAPDNTDYRLLLGELLLTSGDTKEALTQFDAALKQDPKLVPAYNYRAKILLKSDGNAADALKAAERAVALAPESAEANQLQGRALVALGQVDKGIPLLERAATLAPYDPIPVRELVGALAKQGRDADVARWKQELQKRMASEAELTKLDSEYRRQPSSRDAARKLAHYWGERGEVNLVVRYEAKALRQEQDAPPTLIAAANDLTEGGFPDRAMELLNQVQARTQMNPAGFEALGNTLLALDKPREAAVQYETAARWMPDKRDAYKKKLSAYFARIAAKPTEGMRLYGEAISMERSQVGPRPVTPVVRDLLRKAAALEPKNTTIRREFVRSLMELQENEEGIREARALLEISPEDTMTHVMLAIMMESRAATETEYQEIQYHINKAKADHSLASLVWYADGKLALLRNQPDTALSSLRTAYKFAPNSDPILFALAQAERLNGHKDIADKLAKDYANRRAEKATEANLLRRIAEAPDDPARYREAITHFEQRGKTAEAAAIRQVLRSRFKSLQ